MTLDAANRPTCPVCQSPVRDIEYAMVQSQRDLSRDTSTETRRLMVLFCGHRVELVVSEGVDVFIPR